MDTEQKPQEDSSVKPENNTINQPSATNDQSSLPPTTRVSENKSKMPPLLIGVLIVIILAIGGLVAYGISHDKTKQTSQTIAKKDIPLVRFGEIEEPTNIFYPAATTDNTNYDINQQIFEGLVQYQNKTKLVPLLATSWTTPTDTTWIFNLRQGVSFHTGRTMTAKDVKYSLENFKDSDLGQVFNTTIKSVDVMSDYQVKITTNGPDPLLLNRLVFLSILDSQSTTKDDPINGTGPYAVKSGTTPSETETDLVAFDKWHGGHIYTKELDYKYYNSEDDLLAAYKKHDVDVIGYVSPAAAEQFRGSSTIDIRNSIGTYYLGINALQKSSPLANLKVRQALYYATDVAALTALPHYKTSYTVPQSSQIVSAGVPGYDSSIKPIAHDAVKAKQLLAEAGYPKGVTLTLTYYVTRQDVADELTRQLAEAGITLKQDSNSDGGALDKKVFDGQSQMWFASYASDLIDQSDVVSRIFQGKNYDNATIDSLQTQASQTFDQTKRLALLKQESRTLMSDVAWIPLFPSQLTWVRNSNYAINVDRGNDSFGVNFATVYAK